MSSQAERPSFVLTRRLADGTVEWIPIEIPQRVPAAPEADYALIDRADYEAPETLVARRQGDDLVVEVQGTEVLVLDGFFATRDVAFHPTTDIAGGAGPFSGPPLTPGSPVLTGSPAGEQVVWSAEPSEGEQVARSAEEVEGAGGSRLLWGGLAAGGLGLAVAAGGGGGGGGGDGAGGSGGGVGGSGEEPDTSAPLITSGDSAAEIAENSGAGQVVYTATATDDEPVSWSLEAGGDAADFTIDPTTGAVTLTENPDFETKSSYSFTVVATDAAGNSASQAVSLSIEDQDDSAPFITSDATADAIDENSGSGQVVYTAEATDDGPVTWSLEAGGDAADFSIDATTGAVTLTGNPDFETKSSYDFTVVATDAEGNSSAQAVSLAINDLDEAAPSITSGDTAAAIDESSGPGQTVYDAEATDDTPVTWSLEDGRDAADFSIDAATGAVTLTDNPDFETKSSYDFTVVATDAEGNSSTQAVSLAINDLDEAPPSITSGDTAAAIDENSGPGQTVYDAEATDDTPVTWSLEDGRDAAAFSIDATTGAVTLTDNPDFETKSSYSFTVVATDAAGNSSEQAVSLAINDLDEAPPTVANIELTSAVGAQNDTLNAGDTVSVTVTMSENTDVDTSGGTPRIALSIGGSTVFADYASGSGSASLIFQYTIQPGDTDSNGISIRPNSLEPNGGAVTDTSGNAADLSHGAVPSNPSFVVDTTAPTLSSTTPADDATEVPVGDDIVLTFSEDVQAGSGNITISISNGDDDEDDDGDSHTIDVTDSSQVSISGNVVTINPASDLNADSTYNVSIDSGALTDAAGNAYAGISDSTTLNFDTGADTSIVVFDLVQGSSSDHSGRTFAGDVSYDIYIRVDSDDAALSTEEDGPGTWGIWSGAANLGSDDRVILVGDGEPVEGPFGDGVDQVSVGESTVAWQSSPFGFIAAAGVVQEMSFTRVVGGDSSDEILFNTSLPAAFLNGQEGQMNTMHLTNMPAGILTSQGLV